MDSCWGKALLIILAIAFFPITITIFILKSDMEAKGKLIATVLLWGGLYIASLFLLETVKEKPSLIADTLSQNFNDSENIKDQIETDYDYDTERIIREGHPKLLDSMETAESFWNDDLKANVVVIRNEDEHDYPYAYLLIDCGQIHDDSKEKIIQSVHTSFVRVKCFASSPPVSKME